MARLAVSPASLRTCGAYQSRRGSRRASPLSAAIGHEQTRACRPVEIGIGNQHRADDPLTSSACNPLNRPQPTVRGRARTGEDAATFGFTVEAYRAGRMDSDAAANRKNLLNVKPLPMRKR